MTSPNAADRLAPAAPLVTPRVIHAPWPAVVIAALDRYQRRSDRHPYTCPADGTLGSVEHLNGRTLVANGPGWFCPSCNYRQTWARTDDIGDAGAHDATADESGRNESLDLP